MEHQNKYHDQKKILSSQKSQNPPLYEKQTSKKVTNKN